MADAAAQPQVIANIVPNLWSVIHLDIIIENTGNATAFDVQVVFDPPLKNGSARGEDMTIPFQRISLLKPGQALKSYLRDVGNILDEDFRVETSWKLAPESQERESLSYELRMSDYKGVSYLGSRDPIVQVADQLKKLREDWKTVASGSRRIKADTFDVNDRQREEDVLEERYNQMRQTQETETES